MILPGFERQDVERVRGIIKYKRQLRFALPDLKTELARLSNFAHPELYSALHPSDAPFAYLHAAELALAIDDVKLAVEVLLEFTTSFAAQPRTTMQLCWLALAGAISGDLVVELSPFNYSIKQAGDRQPDRAFGRFSWPTESVAAVEVARRNLPAMVANTPPTFGLADLQQLMEGSFEKSVRRSLQLTAEYQTIYLFWGDRPKPVYSVSGLSELEARFAEGTRRALARSDLHPSVPKDFIDFSLLGIYVGLEREGRSELLHRRDELPEVAFLRDTAKKIALITGQFRQGSRRGRDQ